MAGRSNHPGPAVLFFCYKVLEFNTPLGGKNTQERTAFFSFLVNGFPDFESSGTIRSTTGALTLDEVFSICSISKSRILEGPAWLGSSSM